MDFFYVCAPVDVVVSFTPKSGVLYSGGNVTFFCNLMPFGRFWLINDTATRRANSELPDGLMADGNMLIVTKSANDTLYGCGVVSGASFVSDTGIVYLAGTCDYAYAKNNET